MVAAVLRRSGNFYLRDHEASLGWEWEIMTDLIEIVS
jgi:hypothetical protein